MNRNYIIPTGESPVQASIGKSPRLVFIDYLRTFLVILVVLHHVSMVYGASSPFYYVEPPLTSPLAFLVLLVFALVNQSWFMGAFFLLAGYFSPGSFDRKGAGSFLKGRLLRLGVPLIIYSFILNPIAEIGPFLMPASLTGITEPLTWQIFRHIYPELIGIGPLWFVAMLLIFSIIYAGWRMLVGKKTSSSTTESSLPGYLGIGIFILGLALVTFFIRMAIPLGKSVSEFPTLAYLPQYLTFFVIGTVAFRRNWFQNLSGSMGVTGFLAALVAGVILFPLAFSGKLFSLELSEALGNAMGYGHWQSAVYALWDSIFAVGMCLGLITLFRRFFNGQGKFGKFLARHGYSVYILHIPIIVVIAYMLRDIALGSLLKFGLAAIIVVPTCFVSALIVQKIPGVAKVL